MSASPAALLINLPMILCRNLSQKRKPSFLPRILMRRLLGHQSLMGDPRRPPHRVLSPGVARLGLLYARNAANKAMLPRFALANRLLKSTLLLLPLLPDDASESSGDGDFTFQMMTQVAKPFVPKPGPRTHAEVLLTQHTTSPPIATILAQGATSFPRRLINKDLVLLDSQSTVHLFSQPEHVSNIRAADTSIWVHCNKGMLETTQVADFGDTPVYFDSRGIANVSLSTIWVRNSRSRMIVRTAVVFSRSLPPRG